MQNLNNFDIKQGELINNRYRIVSHFIDGATAGIFQCLDLKTQKDVVLKIFVQQEVSHIYIKHEKHIFDQFKKIKNSEIFFPICYDFFESNGYTCMVLEKYGANLYEVLKFYKFQPFKRVAIQQFLKQITESLIILLEMNYYHSDLKPENVLIDPSIKLLRDEDVFIDDNKAQSKPLKIKLIDFGALKKANKWDTYVTTTVYYRAPEVLMGLRYGKEIDIWSLGCMVLELYTGKVPFLTENHLPHIISIQHMLGKIPPYMINNCTNKQISDCAVNGVLNPSVLTQQDKESLYALKPVFTYFKDDYILQDLVMKMLQIDPLKRITLQDILKHPFLNGS